MGVILRLFSVFPWWGAVLILGGFVLFVRWYITWKFNQIVRETILEVGSGMKDARVEVHATAAVGRPVGPSPYDLDEDDEQYAPELDGTEWDEEGVNFYSIDATITPADPTTAWDPTGLGVVPADWLPDDPTDACVRMGEHIRPKCSKGRSSSPSPKGKSAGRDGSGSCSAFPRMCERSSSPVW